MQIFLLLVRVVTAEGDVGHVRREERVKGTHDCSVVALAKVTNVDWVLSTICGNIYGNWVSSRLRRICRNQRAHTPLGGRREVPHVDEGPLEHVLVGLVRPTRLVDLDIAVEASHRTLRG
jgi:hypothetical protein